MPRNGKPASKPIPRHQLPTTTIGADQPPPGVLQARRLQSRFRVSPTLAPILAELVWGRRS